MFSFGIEPSITRTNGASSSSRTACRNGSRNSSPPSVGDRTLLCRCTLGRPGMAPRSTSSIPGWPAAVIETESPSQLMPSEIQRTCTSSTPEGLASNVAAMGRPFADRRLVIELECLHLQLLAREHVHLQPPATRAAQGEVLHHALRGTRAAPSRRRDGPQLQLRAVQRRTLRHEPEGEVEGVRNDLSQRSDAHLDLRDAAPGRVAHGHVHDRLGDRELMHQQILGSGSPTSWSMTRRPPKAVSTRTTPGGSVRTSPISAASPNPSTERSAASAASA